MFSMTPKVKETLVSLANITGGHQSCWTVSAALPCASTRPNRNMSGFWNRQMNPKNTRIHHWPVRSGPHMNKTTIGDRAWKGRSSQETTLAFALQRFQEMVLDVSSEIPTNMPGHALHENVSQSPKSFVTLVSSRERRAADKMPYTGCQPQVLVFLRL